MRSGARAGNLEALHPVSRRQAIAGAGTTAITRGYRRRCRLPNYGPLCIDPLPCGAPRSHEDARLTRSAAIERERGTRMRARGARSAISSAKSSAKSSGCSRRHHLDVHVAGLGQATELVCGLARDVEAETLAAEHERRLTMARRRHGPARRAGAHRTRQHAAAQERPLDAASCHEPS